jgi:adenosylhomocysteinase
VSVRDLERIAVRHKKVRPEVVEYTLRNKKRLYLLSEGRLVNLAAADGHPAEVMDMSFADQALSAEYLSKNKGKLSSKVIKVPEEIDLEVARQRLEAFGRKIDILSRLQQKYLRSWQA